MKIFSVGMAVLVCGALANPIPVVNNGSSVDNSTISLYERDAAADQFIRPVHCGGR
jgi:hypothetical protein